MNQVSDLIQDALAAQQQVLKAWDDLSTRGYRTIKRKYGHLGHALDELTVKAERANSAIVNEDVREPNALPHNIYALPEGCGFTVPVLGIDDEWSEITLDANLSLIGEGGGVTFYVATPDGMYTVAHYPAGWYGPIRPVLIKNPDSVTPKRRRKKIADMDPDERREALSDLRQRLDLVETASTEAAEPVATTATYVSQQIKDQISKDLAAGEFPPDDMGTDAGGTPIAPPKKVKDVWGKGEPPEEPKGLPTTEEAHEAELSRLRTESDMDNYGEVQPNSPDFSQEVGIPKVVQINTDGSIPGDNLPPGAKEYAAGLAEEPPS